MSKRKHSAKRHTPRSMYAFFRSKLFYFLGFAVIVAIASYQSGFTRIASEQILGNTNVSEQQEQVRTQNQETETKTAIGVVKTKVEDNGALKIESAKPGYEFKLETQNGQSELQVEDTKGNTLHKTDQQNLEQELKDEGIDVSTEEGKFALTKNNARALSDMPISVDTTRRQIMVTTPNGHTVPVLLPDVAISKLTSFGILTGSTSSGGLAATPSAFTLTANSNGIPVYTVPGYKEENLFGVIPVKVPVSSVISAETGALMEQNQDFFARLLDAISF